MNFKLTTIAVSFLLALSCFAGCGNGQQASEELRGSAFCLGCPAQDGLVYRGGSGSPVLFIHGLHDDSGTWNGMYMELCKNKEEWFNHHEFWTFQYDSNKPIQDNAEILKGLLSDKGGKGLSYFKTIVGHSMGGLVARSYITKDGHVNKLVTLGTPHLGTPVATIIKYIWLLAGPVLGPILAHYLTGYLSNNDLSSDSSFISNLNSNQTDKDNRYKYVTFASGMDCYWHWYEPVCQGVHDWSIPWSHGALSAIYPNIPNDGLVAEGSALLDGTDKQPTMSPWCHTELVVPKVTQVYEYIRDRL